MPFANQKPVSFPTAKQSFRADLVDFLFENMGFVSAGRNWSESADNGVVNWNEEGSPPDVIFNHTVVPSATERDDVRRFYELDSVLTSPTFVDWVDEYVTNYDKRASCVRQHGMKIVEQSQNRIWYRWASDASVSFETTGDAADEPDLPGGPVKKKISQTDVMKLARQFDIDKIPTGERLLVLPAYMYYELTLIDNFVTIEKMTTKPLVDGVVGSIYNFQVVLTTGTLYYDAISDAPIIPIADDTATPTVIPADANLSGIAFQADHVTWAISPEMHTPIIETPTGWTANTYGTTGGATWRSNGKGVYTLRRSNAV